MRHRLPDTRAGWTRKCVIQSATEGRVKFFVTVNEYPDSGQIAEVFLHMDESGSLLDGFCDAWATALSIYLQTEGANIKGILKKFAYAEFEPKGMTDDEEIPMARSIPDYVCRKIAKHYNISLEGK